MSQPVTIRKSPETTYDHRPKLAVWAGERLVGYVWKDEHRDHASVNNVLTGTRVRSVWLHEASKAVAGNRQELDHADRERAYRLATPGYRSMGSDRRRDAVDQLLASVETLDRLYGRVVMGQCQGCEAHNEYLTEVTIVDEGVFWMCEACRQAL